MVVSWPMEPGWDTAQRNNIEQLSTGPTPYREGHWGQQIVCQVAGYGGKLAVPTPGNADW